MDSRRLFPTYARRAVLLALLWLSLPGPSRAEVAYQYTSAFFDNVAGIYTTSDRLTGQFTTAAPLPANLSFQDISSLVTSFSFSDGHQTISELDLGNFFVFDFYVSTDSAGEIADWRIQLFLSDSERTIQTFSESGSHNDTGSIDLSNYGGIFGTRGSWVIQTTQEVPAMSRVQGLALGAALIGLATPMLRRARRRRKPTCG
jgi:hypothetical protein